MTSLPGPPFSYFHPHFGKKMEPRGNDITAQGPRFLMKIFILIRKRSSGAMTSLPRAPVFFQKSLF